MWDDRKGLIKTYQEIYVDVGVDSCTHTEKPKLTSVSDTVSHSPTIQKELGPLRVKLENGAMIPGRDPDNVALRTARSACYMLRYKKTSRGRDGHPRVHRRKRVTEAKIGSVHPNPVQGRRSLSQNLGILQSRWQGLFL